jgi:DNA-binding GntR family transcriptional regulator
MSATTTTVRGRLTESAYAYIRDGILRGDFRVGQPLAEEEIAAALEISRTPVRHALARLLHEGLLEPGTRRQLLVRGFTPEHREELLVIREALEAIAVERACAGMDVDAIDRLRLNLMRQRRAASEARENEFIDLDEAFHLGIAEGAQLPILLGMLSQLRGFVRVLRIGTTRHAGHLAQVVLEHEELLDLIERRDPEAAVTALRRHLHTNDYILEGTREST